jgi:hypothetical protein
VVALIVVSKKTKKHQNAARSNAMISHAHVTRRGTQQDPVNINLSERQTNYKSTSNIEGLSGRECAWNLGGGGLALTKIQKPVDNQLSYR